MAYRFSSRIEKVQAITSGNIQLTCFRMEAVSKKQMNSNQSGSLTKMVNACQLTNRNFKMKLVTCLFILYSAISLNTCATEPRSSPDELLNELESRLHKYHNEKLERLPESIRAELIKCRSEQDLNKIDIKSQTWLHESFNQIEDDSLVEIIEKIDEIKIADDAGMILKTTFWCKVNDMPFDLENKIRLLGVYWKEHERPQVKFAPISRAKVDWIWKLSDQTRPHGVIHVGIDEETREFLCYDQVSGVYYPKGMLIDRIRAEIVQDSVVSGTNVGRGRIEHLMNQR